MILRSRWLQMAILLVALTCYIYLPVWSVWHAVNSNDFKHIYLGMKALLDGNSPYPIQSLHHQAALQGYREISVNPFVYLPFTGYAMAFLAPFSLSQAELVWFIVNHLFVAGSVLLLSGLFPRWRVGAAAILLLALSWNMPLYRTLTAGQLNLALLFMICSGFRLMQLDRSRLVGVLMAFAALYKLMPGIFGLYLLLRRKWSAALSMATSGIVLAVMSVLAAGPKITAEFFPVLRQMRYGKSTWPEVFSFWDDPPNQSLNSFFSHIFTVSEHTTPWIAAGQQFANLATILCTLSLIGIWVFTLVRNQPLAQSKQFTMADEAAWCATLILGLLIPSLMWDHYLVMLILPAAWIVSRGITLRRPLAVCLAIASFAVTCIPWNFEAEAWRLGPGIFLMSLKLWPTLVLFGLSLCFTRWSSANVADDQVVSEMPAKNGKTSGVSPLI